MITNVEVNGLEYRITIRSDEIRWRGALPPGGGELAQHHYHLG